MSDFERLGSQRRAPEDKPAGASYGGTDLQDAALAVERVLAAAHERGCVEAVRVLSVFANLLRDIARQ